MRTWNVIGAREKGEAFEPTAAEVFRVQGKNESRLFIAIAPQYGAEEQPCAFCAFEPLRLCRFAPFLCKQTQRKDKRQIITVPWVERVRVNSGESRED